MSNINTGILTDPSVVRPRNLTQYKAFRGITDFTQIGQFDQYETGYQFLEVISIPNFLKKDPSMAELNKSFVHMLEFEFRGLEGLNDIQADTYEITDGINTQRMINRVTWDTAVTVSMPYFEKRGSLITKYSEYYLTGIKDPKTQAKTYHGLIANNTLEPSLENEVFTLLYYVTDNTMLRLERAVLLANCQLTKAELSMYNGSRESINNREMQIEFNCFPIIGYEVDKAAAYLLSNITGYKSNIVDGVHKFEDRGESVTHTTLDSSSYRYGILDPTKTDTYANPKLANAINGADADNYSVT